MRRPEAFFGFGVGESEGRILQQMIARHLFEPSSSRICGQAADHFVGDVYPDSSLKLRKKVRSFSEDCAKARTETKRDGLAAFYLFIPRIIEFTLFNNIRYRKANNRPLSE